MPLLQFQKQFHFTTLLSMCFDRISFAHLHLTKQISPVTLAEARRGIRKDCIAKNIEATSVDKARQKHDPQRILSCLTSLWAAHLHALGQMNCSRRGILRSGWSCPRQESHLRRSRQNCLAAEMPPKTRYSLQGLQISENNTAQTSAPTEEKVPFLSLFLWLRKEAEQVVCPTARLNINPGGSTRRKFQTDTGEECIPQETKIVVDSVVDDKNESTKSRQEKLQIFTWTLVVPDMNAIHRKIQIEQPGQTSNVDPATTRYPMKGRVRESKQKNIFVFLTTSNGTCLLFAAGVLYFGVLPYPQTHALAEILRKNIMRHDTCNPQRHPAHARSAPTKAARMSRRLPGWLPGMNQCGISWNICSRTYRGEKVHGKNRATPEFYVLCLCCELCFGCFGCLTVFSLNILSSFSAEAELWNVSADVDLLPIADVLTSCPSPPKPLDLLLILKGSGWEKRGRYVRYLLVNLFWLNLDLARPEDNDPEPTTTTESFFQSSRHIIL